MWGTTVSSPAPREARPMPRYTCKAAILNVFGLHALLLTGAMSDDRHLGTSKSVLAVIYSEGIFNNRQSVVPKSWTFTSSMALFANHLGEICSCGAI